ncbi:unnamed protein product, partial [Tetraodon nigroviridis]
QELQFERLTRELEVERQIVASHLERCRLGAESPGDGSSSSSEKSLPWRAADVSISADTKSRVTDSSQSPCFRIRTESGQVSPYSPEQSSLHESEGSAGNSHSPTQMNSYSDSGYQDVSSGYLSGQNMSKAELRMQHSYPGAVVRNTRAEGQAAAQIFLNSVVHAYHKDTGIVTLSGEGRGSGWGVIGDNGTAGPCDAEGELGAFSLPLARLHQQHVPLPRLPAHLAGQWLRLARRHRTQTPVQRLLFNPPLGPAHQQHRRRRSPYSTQKNSPAALRRVGSNNSRSGSASRTTSPYQTSVGSSSGRMGSPLTMADGIHPPLTKQPCHSSPVRASMTAVPQHYSSTLPRSMFHNADSYGPQSYDVYERMTRPSSLTGRVPKNSSLITELKQTHNSPDAEILSSSFKHTHTYSSLNGSVSEPLRTPQTRYYPTSYYYYQIQSDGSVGSLQRTPSQRGTMIYRRNNYVLNTVGTYADPYHPAQYPAYARQPVVMDDGATRSPSIDSIQKDPREFAWRDPELTEVIHMLQHHFPSVQANAAAYLQHLCYGDNGVKAEVCRLGGIKHLVDLLDNKVLEVQRNSCGALRNLVYGKSMDENKIAVRNAGGVPALLRLLRKSADAEVRELVTGKNVSEVGAMRRRCGARSPQPGVLWNLSSCDAVKTTIIRDALATLTNTVIIPHSGWSSSTFDDDHKLKFHSSLVLRNTSGCLRNLSSAGEEARKQMRSCEGLVDSLLYVIKACVNTSDFDSKIVENCICTLRNLSYRLELEIVPSLLMGGQELDGLLGKESPSKEADSSCWGRKKKKKKKSLPEDTVSGREGSKRAVRRWRLFSCLIICCLCVQWDGVGPIPGFSKSPKGAEMLWHPSVVKPYLTLLAESSNPATLEGAAGSLQNLSAGNWKVRRHPNAPFIQDTGVWGLFPSIWTTWKCTMLRFHGQFAAYIRAAVRKEKGLPILVELLRMDNDRVVCSVATALRNMALDVRNKELIGKYAMRDLVNRLPGGNTTTLSDETVAAICCTLHEVTSKNMENAKALADTGGIEKLVNITKCRGDRYSMKVVKAAAQVLNTLWQYRDLRTIYKKDGWNQNHFLTPASTLERDRFKSQPTLPTSTVQMSPVNHPTASAMSSPAMLGVKEHRDTIPDYQQAQSTMQFYNYQRDGGVHKKQYTGSGQPSPYYYYPSPTREEPRRTQPLYYPEEQSRRNYDTYRMYSRPPHGYEDPYLEEVVTYPPAPDYSSQPQGLKAPSYVDFYASIRRPPYRAEQYPGSPDSWV